MTLNRSESEYEEKHVEAFINSCVNFQSSVTFYSLGDGKVETSDKELRSILLVGNCNALKNKTKLREAFPYYDADVAHGISHAALESTYVARINTTTRIVVGKVPQIASRHNCAARPDVVYRIMKAFLANMPVDTAHTSTAASVDVFYIAEEINGSDSTYAVAIAAAIARAAQHSFSAKKGNAEQGYVRNVCKVRVFLSAENYTLLNTVAMCIQLCQRIVDAPTNLLDTVTFCEIAKRWVNKLENNDTNVMSNTHNVNELNGAAATTTHGQLSLNVIKGEELRESGYGGLYGTGKAGQYPPHLITISYKPQNNTEPVTRLAFVGKGIVYDTGGLALKTRDGMCGMKRDMGGAAAVFCGFLALALLDAPVEMSTILCLADNAIGSRAQRNDDVQILKSGLTVEINNTDAEGRLVLSDGVYHASALLPYTPNVIVDMATLTGAQGIATGQLHAAIYANTEDSEQRFVRTGRECGDLCFPVVYCPELHNAELRSAFADYKNSVANRANAQVSCAGQFIGNNLHPDYKGEWVHVDLAGPATYDDATGFGVALLVQTFYQKE